MGVTPLTLAVTVNAQTELPARTTVTTLPRLSDIWVVGFTVAAATGATAHDTWAPRSGKPSALSTVKPTDSVPPVSTESLSPKMPVIEPALGPVESPPQARAPPMPMAATGTNRRSRFTVPPLFGHDAVEYLAVSNHPELLARHALLQRRDLSALVRELPPDRNPIRGAVLAAPDREREQAHAARETGHSGACHKPYR